MPLAPEQVDRFRTDGFTVVNDFFTADEVRAMQAEVGRWLREGLARNVRTDPGTGEHDAQRANLQLIPLFPHSRLFKALPFSPRVIDAVTSLIGEPIMLHLDQLFYKPAKIGAGTNWHQDNAYFKIRDPMRGTAMWIAIHDATLANGTMRLIPGAFRDTLPHERDPESDHHIRCYPPEDQAVSVEVPAGGVAFFCYGVPHATGANLSDGDRAGVALHFLHQDYAHDDLVADDRQQRPYLTGPKASAGEKEYGEDLTGAWEDEVRTILAGDRP